MNNKKILVLIINYGTNQINFCSNLISNLLSFKNYNFNIKVFSSVNTNFDECENFYVTNYDGNNFALSVYDYLKSIKLSEYSHILLTENDILFTQENFDSFFRFERNYTSKNIVMGFLRYELRDGDRFLIDCGYNENKISLSTKKGITEIDDNLFINENCHQGCWFLPSNLVLDLLHNINVGHTLEDKVSNYFYSQHWPGTLNGIKKFIPICSFEECLIHHQPNKYVNVYRDLPSISELIKQRDENFICN